MKHDQNSDFLKKFLATYEELLAHNGYGDMAVKIRILNKHEREVRLLCGREYTFRVRCPGKGQSGTAARIIDTSQPQLYTGPERRKGKDRRAGQRRVKQVPRNFRLERRVSGERRSGRGRRHDD